jgi:hypothetical protein
VACNDYLTLWSPGTDTATRDAEYHRALAASGEYSPDAIWTIRGTPDSPIGLVHDPLDLRVAAQWLLDLPGAVDGHPSDSRIRDQSNCESAICVKIAPQWTLSATASIRGGKRQGVGLEESPCEPAP